MERGGPTEIDVSRAWHEGRLPTELRTVDGGVLAVVHRGVWSHGFGPDFRDAMLLLDGRSLVTGSVEIHLRTAAWREHGHHLDPRYNDVVLHVVLVHDGTETRRADGALVPVIEIGGAFSARAPAPFPTVDWSRVGGEVCAEDCCRSRPTAVRAVLWRLGDARLAAKAARIEARLSGEPPGEVLYQELWDGLGFSANREPMRAVAGRLPLARLEDALASVGEAERTALALGLLFGVAGLLPLAPVDADAAGLGPALVADLERWWGARGAPWRDRTLPPTAWTRARVRPANHPVRRLAAGAALVASARGGLVAALLEPLRQGIEPVGALRAATGQGRTPAIGEDRASGLITNALLPFALALAEQTGDGQLADAASGAWERLGPGEANDVTRRALRQVAGSARLLGLGARGQQGLLHLDQTLCAPRRCYECPVAALVLADGRRGDDPC